tara:strand:- start:256 stop:447 length:192 start_codon:yes stop_codon:yes gene_type:complete
MENHDPMYGDNTTCDLCKDVFDVRNSPHEVIGDKWICDSCCCAYGVMEYTTEEELREQIAAND